MKLITYLLIALVLISSVSALRTLTPPRIIPPFHADINVKSVFKEGKTVSFDFTINSDEDMDIVYIPFIYCEKAPIPFIEQRTASLKAGKSFRGTYTLFTVNDAFDSQTCTASLRVIEPETLVKKEFRIETKPKVEFDFQLGKIYHLGAIINLDKKGEAVTGFMVFPDKSQKNLDELNSVSLDQLGTHKLTYSVEKQGYRTLTRTDMFSVITPTAIMPARSVCNANQVCDAGETYKNCPQDCKKEDLLSNYQSGSDGNLVGRAYDIKKMAGQFGLFMGAICLLAIILLFYFHNKNKFKGRF